MSSNSSSSSLRYSASFTSSCSSSGQGTETSQADTAPIEESDSPPTEDLLQLKTTKSWGILNPINENLYDTFHMDVEEKSYFFGRGSSCEYVFDKERFKTEKRHDIYASFSKKHFRIFKTKEDNSYSIYLENLSANPVYVNKSKVEKNMKVSLLNSYIISLNHRSNEAFTFTDVEVMLSIFNELPKDFTKKYDLCRDILGSGAMGVVRLARAKMSDEQVAVKMIELKTSSIEIDIPKDFSYEAKIMRELTHPNIVTVKDVFKTDKTLYMVLELMKVDLFQYISDNGRVKETIAKEKYVGLLEAVQYMHNKNIFHRDLKPENILLSATNIENSELKIADFGLSRFADSRMKTICGTPPYIAPEIISQIQVDTNTTTTGYTGKVDIWSLGCILFVVLFGSPPFSEHRKDMPLLEQIKTANYKFNINHSVSSYAKELIKKMLTVDPQRRISLVDALTSNWFQDNEIEQDRKRRKISNSIF